MAKVTLCTFVAALLLFSPVWAQETEVATGGGEGAEKPADVADIGEYLLNLGKYFGYDLKTYSPTDQKAGGGEGQGQGTTGEGKTAGLGGEAPPFSLDLFDAEHTKTSVFNAYSSFLGTLLGNEDNNLIVPEKDSIINQYSIKAFPFPDYASASGKETVSVSQLIDQPKYQTDPTRQAVLNMTSTPEESYLEALEVTRQTGAAPEDTRLSENLSRLRVLNNMWQSEGAQATESQPPSLPQWHQVFASFYNAPYIGQLNSNTLILPLLYAKKALQASSGENAPKLGPAAQTEAQQAANFIRYASGLVNPIELPSFETYSQIAVIATSTPDEKNVRLIQARKKAQVTLSDYLLRLRTYIAQSSVGISNLYYIFSRRLPQTLPEAPANAGETPAAGGGGAAGAAAPGEKENSAALNEFKMASWRLVDSRDKDKQQQWLEKIQKGSAASVQKEIAVLLAEINYQLYLSRQLQERMLMTQSVQLLQAIRVNRPSPHLGQVLETFQQR